MKCFALASAVLISAAAPFSLLAASDIVAPKVTVGRNLQAYTTVRLAQPAPQDGLRLTVTSDDPSRLLLSKMPDQAGSATISIELPPHSRETPEFWLQGLAASGSVSYTVAAPGLESAKGAVTLAPSAIVIVGPFRAPKFPTTPRGKAAKITIVAAALDSELKVIEEQQVAGGTHVDVAIANSNPGAGKLEASKLTLAGGSSSAISIFQPVGEGDTTIAPVQPAGFTAPAQMATVVASVAKPGLAVVGDIFVGKDLQTSASLVLGEPAPPGGLNVTLTSADSSRLILSAREDQVGSASITINVPAGQLVGQYYIQGLGDSGEVAYTASATAFRSGTGTIGLTRSGVIVAYESYGPPDEGNVKRKIGAHPEREFFVSLSDAEAHPVRLVVWTAYVDRETGRSADFTVQPLRAGVSTTVVLASSNTAVATVESPLTIKPGNNRVLSQFTPISKGTTIISINTPPGFSTPGNSTAVPATVRE